MESKGGDLAGAAGSGHFSILIPLILGGAVLIAVMLLWDGQRRREREILDAAIEERARDDIQSAYSSLRAEEYDQALTKIKAIEEVALKPLRKSSPDGYKTLMADVCMIKGRTRIGLGGADNFRLAEEDFTAALGFIEGRGGPAWELSYYWRGWARLRLGQYFAAKEDMDLLLRENPNYGKAYVVRAAALERMDHKAGAEEDRKRAEALGALEALEALRTD